MTVPRAPEVRAVAPAAGIGAVLNGADFVDAYRVTVAGDLEAGEAARLMLARPPAWIRRLLALRNALVAPLGLKTGPGPDGPRGSIGMFPIESVSPGRIVLGFDDRHLDFRVVVDVAATGVAREVTATTLVRMNNRLGRAYLTAILPFHKLVVRAMLADVAAADGRRRPGRAITP